MRHSLWVTCRLQRSSAAGEGEGGVREGGEVVKQSGIDSSRYECQGYYGGG